MDQYADAGVAHGRTSPLRWDVTTASAVLVLGALAYLVFVGTVFKVSGSGSVGIGRK